MGTGRAPEEHAEHLAGFLEEWRSRLPATAG
jgi:hypothetical protein